MKRTLCILALASVIGISLVAIAKTKGASNPHGGPLNASGLPPLPGSAVRLANVAPTVAETYSSTVTGNHGGPAPGMNNPLALNLGVDGALKGRLSASINYNDSHEITGGTWLLVVTAVQPDGSSDEVGTISGSFTGGSVTVGDSGVVATVDGAMMTVGSGTELYSNITTGGGSLGGNLVESGSPSFNGQLNLTF